MLFRLTTKYLELLSDHQLPRNLVDAHVEWMRSKARFTKTDEAQYRKAKTSEQQRIAEDLFTRQRWCSWLTPQGHDIISAKFVSTAHDTFHAFMLSDLDRNGRTTPEMFGESICAWASPLLRAMS